MKILFDEIQSEVCVFWSHVQNSLLLQTSSEFSFKEVIETAMVQTETEKGK